MEQHVSRNVYEYMMCMYVYLYKVWTWNLVFIQFHFSLLHSNLQESAMTVWQYLQDQMILQH